MTRTLIAAAVALSLSVHAKEVSGVQVSPTTSVEGKELKLNGAGTRMFLFFKVYVGSLYVEEPSKDPWVLLTKDGTRRVEMTMLRDLEREKIVEAIKNGFEQNSKEQLPALKARMDKLVALMPEKVTKGQVLKLTYVPGKGTTVSGQGEQTQIEGKDFADALFSVWLGKHPVDDGLKKGMLGLE